MALRMLPTVLSRTSGPETTFTLAMDADLVGFQGHFPGNPILPGVIQVDWAARFGAEAFGDLGRFRGVDHLKFQQIIRPGEVVDLHLALDADGVRLRFHFAVAGEKKSSGILLYAR